MEKQKIKKVLETESILITSLHRNGMTLDDLTSNDYLNDVFDIVNNDDLRQEIIEENKLG